MLTSPTDLVDALRAEHRLAANHAVLFHAAVASRAGIHVTDVHCLAVLDNEGPMPAGHLATRMGLSRGGAITAVVDRMEKAGFVRRQRDTADRRKVLVELVPDGAYAHLRAVFDELGTAYAALVAGYPVEQQALLLDFARRANEIMRHRTEQTRVH
ncbi:MarR family transcriptional regulator [Actinokineospora auranticolor]|uniref:DNA-binding MarR family transcriptional regulator n=1 Tax=Actinokineospora auranticolor TaxID=155976 RepID=A0A2S6H1J1_9PSEU|nr:MarR family transcriptional regulator [Actinokineospora auranticolor]PPK71290.1 DNA-binding MarR family transcriptional regulator [Actinokineospora auranticolor]